MKKWSIILLNIVLCIAHGLCLVFLESFMSVPLIWSDVGNSLNAGILGCVLLCGFFCLLWIGLFLYMMSPWTAWLQVALVIGMNAAVILVRRFICPAVIRRFLNQR